MKLKPLAFAVISLSPGLVLASSLQPIIVNADLRAAEQQDLAASVSVISETELQDRGATHFDDVLLQTPNVNYSGQSSRARHIQIRGMGERDEYTGAPNASVGFAVDNIDFSGIGMVGNLFDVKQVEVLRGPQSTRYGASAIAGLVNIQTNDPTPYNESLIEATLGSDNLSELGIATSGAFSSNDKSPQYRLSLFKHDSDGFRDNKTLNRSDTDGRDELTARAKLRWWAGESTQFDLTLMHANLNNGYDHWSRDNSFTTRSDQPGKDTQKTNAASLKIGYEGNPNYTLTSTTSFADSDMVYSYDDDWTEVPSAFYDNNKKRQTAAQELRWVSNKPIFQNSTDWLTGIYTSQLKEDNRTQYYGETTTSDFKMTKLSVFGQLDHHLTNKKTLITGLRIERVTSDFSNSLGDDFSPSETLWGGSIHYQHQYSERHIAFAGISRGYKAGGFNTSLNGPDFARFGKETLYNYEIGLRSNYGDIKTTTNLFFMDRKTPQFDGYTEGPNGEPWVFFTENLDSAKHYGLETEIDWHVNSQWNFFAQLGLLKTEIKGTPINQEQKVPGRGAAHAPNYQYLIGGQYRSDNGWFSRLEVQGMDAFYFDNVHNEKSSAYTLVNARLGYEAADWEVYLWGKNLTDESYATRGYLFDHFDGDGEQRYLGLGDPRQIGLTARVRF
ncbi:TonB-dependent receptor [Thiomicrospira microaerophila]|uniref:TonB-dependent receptor n=1 Tax=Thiomicrospira microaerophila TaxID=406020 RepID=UPI00200D164F|nr:TonB-dependent receptor [Thiomicrospira microaerophila]UQB42691.1 TonB-dependent receptor [Thiomicrospira microaerophila]